MRIAFDALPLAKSLRGFTDEELGGMQVVVDGVGRRVAIEVVGWREACELLREYRFRKGKDYLAGDAIDAAASLILKLEAEGR